MRTELLYPIDYGDVTVWALVPARRFLTAVGYIKVPVEEDDRLQALYKPFAVIARRIERTDADVKLIVTPVAQHGARLIASLVYVPKTDNERLEMLARELWRTEKKLT